MISPQRINALLWERWKTKMLESAVQLRVFTELSKQPLSLGELEARLGLNADRIATKDYFDALVAVGLLEMDGERYGNGVEAAEYLDENKPATYVGKALAQGLSAPLIDLAEVLRSGRPPTAPPSGQEFYRSLYATPEGVQEFLRIMTASSVGPALAIAEKFPWQRYSSLVDVGCAEGALTAQVVSRHPHLGATGFDLPVAQAAFEEHTAALGVADRVRFVPGDFLRDGLPPADVVVFGRILHNWDLDQKRTLIGQAYDALPDGGAVIVYETLIDGDRAGNATALFMSLMMNLVVGGGFDFTGTQCQRWLEEGGFTQTYVEHLDGPQSMVVGIK
jgi:hypothetical protein